MDKNALWLHCVWFSSFFFFCPAAPLYSGVHDAQAGNCRVSPQVQRSPKTQGTPLQFYHLHFALNSGTVFQLTGPSSISLLLTHVLEYCIQEKGDENAKIWGGKQKSFHIHSRCFLSPAIKGNWANWEMETHLLANIGSCLRCQHLHGFHITYTNTVGSNMTTCVMWLGNQKILRFPTKLYIARSTTYFVSGL